VYAPSVCGNCRGSIWTGSVSRPTTSFVAGHGARFGAAETAVAVVPLAAAVVPGEGVVGGAAVVLLAHAATSAASNTDTPARIGVRKPMRSPWSAVNIIAHVAAVAIGDRRSARGADPVDGERV
jgi:hypothetical protein